MHESRLTAVEEKVAFIEHQFDELSGVVRELSATMTALSRRLDRLAEAIAAADDPSGGPESID